jgi:quinol monooxygenase YgiN
MKPLTVLASLKIADGRNAEVMEALQALAGPSRAEPGCLSYVIYCNPEDASDVLIHEIWRSRDDWLLHIKTPHLIAFKEVVLPGCAVLTAGQFWPAGQE